MTTRTDLITEARSWIGTRFHHQGRIKKTSTHRGGCDCIGFIIGVADNVGLTYKGRPFSTLDRTDYAKLPDGVQLQKAFASYLHNIPIDDRCQGDVLMFRFDKEPQHVALVSEKERIIHCYLQARGVVEHSLDSYWQERVVAAYRFDCFS